MTDLDILFPLPTGERNADDMGMPSPIAVVEGANMRRELECMIDGDVTCWGIDDVVAYGMKVAATERNKKALELQADAERYRWLRDRFDNNWGGKYFERLEGRGCYALKQGSELDFAIDAAMKEPT